MSNDGWNSDTGEEPNLAQPYHSSKTYSHDNQFRSGGFGGDNRGNSGFRRGGRGGRGGRREDGFGGVGRDNRRTKDDGGGWGNKRRNDDGGGGRGNRRDESLRGGKRQGNGYNSDVVTMTVGSYLVGKIIGKGGSKIRELQDQSGARIKVSNDETGDGKIVIMGAPEAQSKAKELIEEIVKESESSGGPLSFLNAPADNSTSNSDSFLKNGIIDWDNLNKAYDEAQKERLANLPPMIKDFYREHPDVTNMSETEVEQFRLESNNIMVSRVFGESETPIPNPVKTFEHAFADYPEILGEIKKQGFSSPSAIQCQAWPALLQGMDLIGISQTGSGKTLAFLLPALIHIEGQPIPRSQRGGANVLILAPTRELALQIDKEVKKYSYRGIKCICVYGGGSRKEQANVLTGGVEIIIATPGRLNDFVNDGKINVSAVTYLVLDEADRMLDMGFEPQIRKVLLDVRPDRQTVMTSATWPEGVRRLAQSYMKDPIQAYIGTLDLAACHSVTQVIRIIPEDHKMMNLRDFLNSMMPEDKAIVFVGKKVRADDISSDLAVMGLLVQSIHGDREQCDREQALEDIKSGAVKVLIATDVASRGIDIGDITHIINYDFPRNIEEYVHRVGRTGRAGRTGTAITFVTREDWGHAKELIDILEEANQEIPEELIEMMERYDAMKVRKAKDRESGLDTGRGGRGGGGRFGSSRGSAGRRGGGRSFGRSGWD